MHLIKRYLNKFVPVLCVLAVLVSCLVFPASASEIETENHTGLLHFDLLTSTEYSFLPNSRVYESPFANYYSSVSSNRVGMEWVSTGVYEFNKVVFAVSSAMQPASVFFSGIHATFESALDYDSGNSIYFYSVSTEDLAFRNNFNIICFYDSDYLGVFGVLSCIGLLDTASSISSVDVYRRDWYDITEGYTYTDATPILNKSLPYTYSAAGDFKSDFFFVVDGNDFVSPLVNGVSVLLNTCCETIWSSAGLIKKDSGIGNVENIEVNLYTVHEWVQSSDEFKGQGMASDFSTFQIDFDLSGYDMSQYDLLITVGVSAIDKVYDVNTPYIDLTLSNISYIPFVSNTPWYKSFFTPVFNSFKMVFNKISNGIADFKSSVTGNFNTLFDKLEQYFGDDGELAQAGDQMSQQAGQMNEANDALNSTDKPSLDTDSMFSGILNFDTGGLTILASMTSNAYVAQILVVVFTFALCSYVFFGKRI